MPYPAMNIQHLDLGRAYGQAENIKGSQLRNSLLQKKAQYEEEDRARAEQERAAEKTSRNAMLQEMMGGAPPVQGPNTAFDASQGLPANALAQPQQPGQQYNQNAMTSHAVNFSENSLKISQAIKAMTGEQQQRAQLTTNYIAKALAAVELAAPEDRQRAYEGAIQDVRQHGITIGDVPPQYDSVWVQGQIAQARETEDMIAQITPEKGWRFGKDGGLEPIPGSKDSVEYQRQLATAKRGPDGTNAKDTALIRNVEYGVRHGIYADRKAGIDDLRQRVGMDDVTINTKALALVSDAMSEDGFSPKYSSSRDKVAAMEAYVKILKGDLEGGAKALEALEPKEEGEKPKDKSAFLKKIGDILKRSGAPRAPTPPQAAQQGPAQPQSQEEFDALPPGTLFVNPADGVTMRKK